MFANPIFQKMGGFESACFSRTFIHCTRQGLSPVCCCFLPDTFLWLPVQLGRQKHNNVYTKNMKSEKAFVGYGFWQRVGYGIAFSVNGCRPKCRPFLLCANQFTCMGNLCELL